jgi:hypothetical protein
MFSIVTDVFFFWNFGKSTEKTARRFKKFVSPRLVKNECIIVGYSMKQ